MSYLKVLQNGTMLEQEALNEIIQHGISKVEDLENIEVDKLHHHLYNEDYFINGYYKAEQFLNKTNVFWAIKTIQEYDKDLYGECLIDFGDSEKVANMLAYIIGEEILNECEVISSNQGESLSKKQIKKLGKELTEML
ncbi:hypothetical protein LCGC14_0342240 [marine sediment metagenome]|uniref:Uncharacterized protein n=1 Tax=marine sediment metagenome TaxID=412755 RepID=A0A0F9TW77_9ZZZZ